MLLVWASLGNLSAVKSSDCIPDLPNLNSRVGPGSLGFDEILKVENH